MLENGVSPPSVLSKVSKSSSVADGCKEEARERLKNSIDGDDDARESGRSRYQENRKNQRWAVRTDHPLRMSEDFLRDIF